MEDLRLKYEINIHIFKNKLNTLLLEHGIVDKRGKPDPIKLYNLLYPNDTITEDLIRLDRQRVTDKTRSIRNWIQGKNYPRSIKDILELCNILNCDLDYLFTDMECKTHDIEFIHEYTGLSETAISYLHEKSRSKRYLEILNIFLKYGNFDNALFHIDKYMKTVYLYEGLTKIRQERRKKIISECIQNDGDLTNYNYPYNDALEKKINETEKDLDIEEFKIDQHFKFIIQEIQRIAKEKAPDTN